MAATHLHPGAKTFPAELESELKSIGADTDAADIEISKLHEKLYAPIYAKRSEVIKKIPGFWHQTLVNFLNTNMFIDDVDQDALSYITDIKVTRDDSDLRKSTLTFEFKENPYFTNTSLTRTFEPSAEAPPLVDFTPTEDWTSKKVAIDWKDDEHNLVKQRPNTHSGDDEDDDFEPGSLFATLFDTEIDAVCNPIAHTIIEDLFSNALDVYTGDYLGGGFDDDELDDEDEDDEDDEAEEIDLEAPARKKPKTN